MGHSLQVRLSINERNYLNNLIRRKSTSSFQMKRAKILLFADHNCNNWKKYTEIAEILESSSSTVSIICRQYSLNGLKYVLSARPKLNRGRIIKITEEVEFQLTSLINGEPPEGQRRWTLKLLAQELVKAGVVESISKVAIHKYLKKQIKPR